MDVQSYTGAIGLERRSVRPPVYGCRPAALTPLAFPIRDSRPPGPRHDPFTRLRGSPRRQRALARGDFLYPSLFMRRAHSSSHNAWAIPRVAVVVLVIGDVHVIIAGGAGSGRSLAARLGQGTRAFECPKAHVTVLYAARDFRRSTSGLALRNTRTVAVAPHRAFGRRGSGCLHPPHDCCEGVGRDLSASAGVTHLGDTLEHTAGRATTASGVSLTNKPSEHVPKSCLPALSPVPRSAYARDHPSRGALDSLRFGLANHASHESGKSLLAALYLDLHSVLCLDLQTLFACSGLCSNLGPALVLTALLAFTRRCLVLCFFGRTG